MRSINEREISGLREWAVQENAQGCFDRNRLENTDSFWIDRADESTYIKEYGFTTVPEFETLCVDILGHEFDNQIKKTVSVAVMKNTPHEEIKKEEAVGREEELPDYIYVF